MKLPGVISDILLILRGHRLFNLYFRFRDDLNIREVRCVEICIVVQIRDSKRSCLSEGQIRRIRLCIRFLRCFYQFLRIILDLEICDHGISGLNDFLRGRTIEFHRRNSLLNSFLLCRRQFHLREINAGHDVMNSKIFDTSILHFNRRQIVDRIREISGDVCTHLQVSVCQNIFFRHACGKTSSDA